MDNVISIRAEQINGQYIDTVDARDLYEFLEVSARFNDWVLRRIEKYGFVENQDFTTFTQKRVKGRPSLEYHLSLDMAKELSMVERTEKGKQARQYFIDCERRTHHLAPATPQNPILAGISTLALELDRTQLQVADLEARVNALTPRDNVVAFPKVSKPSTSQPPMVDDLPSSWRSSNQLYEWFKGWLKRNDHTLASFSRDIGVAKTTMVYAMTGQHYGPTAKKIKRRIKQAVVGPN